MSIEIITPESATPIVVEIGLSAHTHPLSGLTQSGAATNDVPSWNGTAWVPAAPSGGGSMDQAAITAAITSKATFAADNDLATEAQGTDERVPTAAGLTSKFGTNKATLVDADKVAILDSAASDAPKHGTLTNLWTWITTKLATLSLTTSGTWVFSSTTRPTSAGTTATLAAADASSLITKGDGDARYGRFHFAASSSSTIVNNSTTLVDVGCEITLPAGTYRITGLIISQHNTAAGSKLQLTLSASCSVNGCLYRSRTGSSITPSTLTAGAATALTAIETSGTDYHASCNFAVVITSETTLKWQQAQNAAHASNSTTPAGAWLMAEKVA